jgi:hypothetical protein
MVVREGHGDVPFLEAAYDPARKVLDIEKFVPSCRPAYYGRVLLSTRIHLLQNGRDNSAMTLWALVNYGICKQVVLGGASRESEIAGCRKDGDSRGCGAGLTSSA